KQLPLSTCSRMEWQTSLAEKKGKSLRKSLSRNFYSQLVHWTFPNKPNSLTSNLKTGKVNWNRSMMCVLSEFVCEEQNEKEKQNEVFSILCDHALNDVLLCALLWLKIRMGMNPFTSFYHSFKPKSSSPRPRPQSPSL